MAASSSSSILKTLKGKRDRNQQSTTTTTSKSKSTSTTKKQRTNSSFSSSSSSSSSTKKEIKVTIPKDHPIYNDTLLKDVGELPSIFSVDYKNRKYVIDHFSFVKISEGNVVIMFDFNDNPNFSEEIRIQNQEIRETAKRVFLSTRVTSHMFMGNRMPRLHRVMHHGKDPRLRRYRFAGKYHLSEEMTDDEIHLFYMILDEIRIIRRKLLESPDEELQKIGQLIYRYEHDRVSGVSNYYPKEINGGSIAPHNDDEYRKYEATEDGKFKGYNPDDISTIWTLVGSLVMGMARPFIISQAKTSPVEPILKDPIEITAEPNTFLAMVGDHFQRDLWHSVPKLTQKAIKNTDGEIGDRFSFTFRLFPEDDPENNLKKIN